MAPSGASPGTAAARLLSDEAPLPRLNRVPPPCLSRAQPPQPSPACGTAALPAGVSSSPEGSWRAAACALGGTAARGRGCLGRAAASDSRPGRAAASNSRSGRAAAGRGRRLCSAAGPRHRRLLGEVGGGRRRPLASHRDSPCRGWPVGRLEPMLHGYWYGYRIRGYALSQKTLIRGYG